MKPVFRLVIDFGLVQCCSQSQTSYYAMRLSLGSVLLLVYSVDTVDQCLQWSVDLFSCRFLIICILVECGLTRPISIYTSFYNF